MPSDREIALALSAAPPKINEHASVHVLERDGYVLARKGSNGFTCLVVREYPQDLGPICRDPEGTRTVVPCLLREAELRAQGRVSCKSEKKSMRACALASFGSRNGLAWRTCCRTKRWVLFPSLGMRYLSNHT